MYILPPPLRRAPEILFQPTMVGIDQCGVSDTIEYVLSSYPLDVQQRLVQVCALTLSSHFCKSGFSCCTVIASICDTEQLSRLFLLCSFLSAQRNCHFQMYGYDSWCNKVVMALVFSLSPPECLRNRGYISPPQFLRATDYRSSSYAPVPVFILRGECHPQTPGWLARGECLGAG